MADQAEASFLRRFSTFALKGAEVTGSRARIFLLLLAALPVLGQSGINHYAVGQYELGFLKFMSSPVSYLLTVLIIPYLPFIFQYEGWLLKFTSLTGSPWYFFDIVQALDAGNFAKTGFQSPIIIGDEILPGSGPLGTKWKLPEPNEKPNFLFSMTLITLIGSSLGLSSSYISAMFPGDIGSKVSEVIGYSGAAITGLGAMTMFGSFIAAGSGASGVAAIAGTAVAASSASTSPSGGGRNALPPLSEIIHKIQSGGAKENKENMIFLSAIGFIAFAGILLGVLRSKQ